MFLDIENFLSYVADKFTHRRMGGSGTYVGPVYPWKVP